MIAHILALHDTAAKEFLRHLAGVNERDVFLIYCRILNIIEKCEELDSYVDIKNIEEKALSEIVKEIQNMPSEAPEKSDFLTIFLADYQAFIPKYPDIHLKSLTSLANTMKRNSNFAMKGGDASMNLGDNFSYSVKISEILEKI